MCHQNKKQKQKRLLEEKAKSITGIHQWPFRALARSFEVIPRTLIQNCGANVIRTLTALRAKHAVDGNATWGVDGNTGELADMKNLGIWEPLAVKQQTYKTAIEVNLFFLNVSKNIYSY